MDDIDSDGFAVIDPGDVLRCIDGVYAEGRYAVLTFDDGREDRHPAIVDVLRTNKLRALAFLYVLEPAMETVRIDWSFWRQHADVFEIGAHSLTHSRVARSQGSAAGGVERSFRTETPGLVTIFPPGSSLPLGISSTNVLRPRPKRGCASSLRSISRRK